MTVVRMETMDKHQVTRLSMTASKDEPDDHFPTCNWSVVQKHEHSLVDGEKLVHVFIPELQSVHHMTLNNVCVSVLCFMLVIVKIYNSIGCGGFQQRHHSYGFLCSY